MGGAGRLVVVFQEPSFVRFVEFVVGAEVAQVEERRVEAGVVPIEEPEALSVIDEVGGEQVVVAEGELDGADACFELGDLFADLWEGGAHAALVLFELCGVLAQDVEHPEGEQGTV